MEVLPLGVAPVNGFQMGIGSRPWQFLMMTPPGIYCVFRGGRRWGARRRRGGGGRGSGACWAARLPLPVLLLLPIFLLLLLLVPLEPAGPLASVGLLKKIGWREKEREVRGWRKGDGTKGRRNAPSPFLLLLSSSREHSNAPPPRSLATPLFGVGTLLGVLQDTQLTIPPPKRRREIDAKGAEAAGSSGEGSAEEEGRRDNGDAGDDPRSRADPCPAWSLLAPPDISGTFTQAVSFDSDAESAASALAGAAAGEAAWKKGHSCEAAAELVIVAIALFAPTSGTTPPSPWKNE